MAAKKDKMIPSEKERKRTLKYATPAGTGRMWVTMGIAFIIFGIILLLIPIGLVISEASAQRYDPESIHTATLVFYLLGAFFGFCGCFCVIFGKLAVKAFAEILCKGEINYPVAEYKTPKKLLLQEAAAINQSPNAPLTASTFGNWIDFEADWQNCLSIHNGILQSHQIFKKLILTINGKRYRYFDSRPLKGKVKTLTVKRDNLGDIYIFAVTQEECNEVLPRAGKAVGMDFGLKHFLNLDDGSVIDSPQWYKASLKELKTIQRHISRCKAGSNNRKKAIKELNRIYRKMCNQRTDWFFKTAYQLIGDYAIICIEDLNLAGMQKLWGRKINDIAFGEFVQILEWAASNCGTEIVKIDRFAPSSKCCSRCGYIYTKLTLKQREWDCPSCGTHHERDVNAAINICRMGLVQMGYPA